jgi:SRSO17 transposase
MSILEMPEAIALLQDAQVPVEAVAGGLERLAGFLGRYALWFYRDEQRELAGVVLEGKLSNLARKTSEPIARQARRQRKPVQHFVGAGKWADDALLGELRRHVGEVWGDADGVLILDASGFAKKGAESCGVERQWCGRLGKVENCQVGVFVGYATAAGQVLVDHRLYLPQTWAADTPRREKCHVPDAVVFQEKWRIALDLWERSRSLPHGWVVADDEFGRVTALRQALRWGGERYVLDVPCNTLVRDLEERPVGADGRPRRPRFERAETWAARQPASAWKKVTVRAGERGELVVRALTRWVQTKDEAGHVGRAERLLVVRPVDHAGDTTYALSNAWHDVALADLVRVKGTRPRIEQALQEAKGEIGLSQYEVRSWVGWHHHMTLSLLALWFLCLEKTAVEKKRRGSPCRSCG